TRPALGPALAPSAPVQSARFSTTWQAVAKQNPCGFPQGFSSVCVCFQVLEADSHAELGVAILLREVAEVTRPVAGALADAERQGHVGSNGVLHVQVHREGAVP